MRSVLSQSWGSGAEMLGNELHGAKKDKVEQGKADRVTNNQGKRGGLK